MHNTTVENVVIPPNRITPFGVHITSQAEADTLPQVTETNDDFKPTSRRSTSPSPSATSLSSSSSVVPV